VVFRYSGTFLWVFTVCNRANYGIVTVNYVTTTAAQYEYIFQFAVHCRPIIRCLAPYSYLLTGFTFVLPCIVIDFLLNNQPDALIIQIYCHKTLHVSGIFSAHHQEFFTVHSPLVSFMQVFDDLFQAQHFKFILL